MSKFLIDEPFIQVSVSLMLEIGQSRAIVLQKLHSLTLKDKCYVATYQDWHELMPFISYDNFKRILVWLEAKKLIIVKNVNGKRSKSYSIDFKAMSDQGFQNVESSIFHKNYQNKKMSFILPSLVNLVGLTSAIFLQDFYYQNGSNFGQMSKKEINRWVPYVGFRQIEILFRDLQIIEIIKSEFRDESIYHEGKHYSVNKPRIDELLISSIAEIPKNGESRKRSGGVDNSLIVDNFEDQSRKRSVIKSQKIGDKVAKDRGYSIDQDQVRSFKDNNTNIMGRNVESGIIPKVKDDIVCLKDRLITYGFLSEVADRRIDEYGEAEIESKIEVLLMTYKKEKKLNPKLITSSLKENYQLNKSGGSMNLQTVKSEDSIMKKHGDKERIEYFAKVDSVVVSTIAVGKAAIAELRAANKPPLINRQSNRFL